MITEDRIKKRLAQLEKKYAELDENTKNSWPRIDSLTDIEKLERHRERTTTQILQLKWILGAFDK